MNNTATAQPATGVPTPLLADWRDYFALLKPRVMTLVVSTGVLWVYPFWHRYYLIHVALPMAAVAFTSHTTTTPFGIVPTILFETT